ncbi:protein O-linked-mannose beta-1,2-N-acetylglucosaminyltransferase 1-like [Penaeus monodon]|uniref:protein O-linked-mannose beta-1,2-N-acetylglucosaminyltransferase 1-like n=1 Tax=Penaeus monodon TaxID=6687 RepID=UPI0018A745F8|nr:protein O-linked-mannose beta-1,2-N-acetylglucosaminyltransferase 1-like [Penaeus monodon]
MATGRVGPRAARRPRHDRQPVEPAVGCPPPGSARDFWPRHIRAAVLHATARGAPAFRARAGVRAIREGGCCCRRYAVAALTSLGSLWASRLVQGEAWAWVGVKDVGTVAEAVSVRRGLAYPSREIWVTGHVAKTPPRVRCEWYTRPDLRRQMTFCEKYDGYGDLCSCDDPFFPEVRKVQDAIPIRETIPVVVVTANKPYHLFRLLRQLFTVPGSWQTPVLIVVDGAHGETIALAEVLKLPVAVHAPESAGNERTNANIRFALHSVFARFSTADKAILLEDDLILSPDILRYFQQTSRILDIDPTVFCVNAFSSNSYKDTASDPRKLLRARNLPHVRLDGDWDFWLTWEDLRKNRDIVFPELSRTFHAGSAGVHVTGFEQESVFNRMIFNQEREVELEDVREVVRERYDERLTFDLKRALELTPPMDVCSMTWVPRASSVPVSVYVYAENTNDKHWGYRLFLSCFLTFDENTHEIYKGVIRLRWHGTVVYLVGCPASPFCRHLRTGRLTKPSRDDLRRAASHRDNWEQTFFEKNPRLYRVSSAPLDRVLNLTNILWNED